MRHYRTKVSGFPRSCTAGKVRVPNTGRRWLAGRLAHAGAHVQYPELPDCDEPCPDRWGVALHSRAPRARGGQDDERVVIGHSLGCVLWLREAATIAPRAASIASCWSPAVPGRGGPRAGGLLSDRRRHRPRSSGGRRDAAGVHRRRPVLPGRGAARYWAQPLGLVVDLLPGAGHLNVEAGYGPWPAMEAWAWASARR